MSVSQSLCAFFIKKWKYLSITVFMVKISTMECEQERTVQWLNTPDNKLRVYKDIFCWQLVAFSFQKASSLEVKFSLQGHKTFVCSLCQSFRSWSSQWSKSGAVARGGIAQWGCFSLAGISHCLGLFINFAGHSDDQLRARQDKIFSDMLLLQIIFKFVFTALSCNMQNISRALCLWCPTADREENVKARGPVQTWTTELQEKE